MIGAYLKTNKKGRVNIPYGPVNPHFGQRYGLPNFRHFEQRHMIISPQLGHGNFVASVVGAMILWHDVHVGMVVVVCSVTVDSS